MNNRIVFRVAGNRDLIADTGRVVYSLDSPLEVMLIPPDDWHKRISKNSNLGVYVLATCSYFPEGFVCGDEQPCPIEMYWNEVQGCYQADLNLYHGVFSLIFEVYVNRDNEKWSIHSFGFSHYFIMGLYPADKKDKHLAYLENDFLKERRGFDEKEYNCSGHCPDFLFRL